MSAPVSSPHQKTRVTKVDVILLCAYPLGLLIAAIAIGSIHSYVSFVLEAIWIFLAMAAIYVLPVATVVWVALNRGQTADAWLWIESALAATWIGGLAGFGFLVLRLRPEVDLAVAVAVAVLVFMTPHFSRHRRRQPKTA